MSLLSNAGVEFSAPLAAFPRRHHWIGLLYYFNFVQGPFFR